MNIELSNKQIVVTGGAGFIGANLCEALLKKGNSVICLDNFATGKRENISSFLHHPNFTLVEGDIRNLSACEKAVKNADYVLHQAALGSVPRSIKDPIASNEVNISGFLNMLVASKEANIKRFVYAASSSTYGDSVILPKKEEVIGKPLSPYAITKYVNELYASIFSSTYGLETIGLRYFNVFGEKQDANGAYAAVIPKFIGLFLKGEPPVFNGDGTYTRDFTYIDNVVQANLLALTTTHKNAINTVFNIAFGERNSLLDLVSYLKEQLSVFDESISKINPIHGKERVGDVAHSHADISKAKQLLGYRPQYSLQEGLKKSVQWYYENL